jgi:hypothetical protein
MVTLAASEVMTEKMLALCIPILAIAGGLFVGAISVVVRGIRDCIAAKHHEESRREIAAYVAEGTMTPDDAYKLLEVRPRKKIQCG